MSVMDNEGHDPNGLFNQPRRRSDVELFWTPPRPGERILGMAKYQDMIVIATDDGVYYISNGRGLMDHEVRKISHDTIEALSEARRS